MQSVLRSVLGGCQLRRERMGLRRMTILLLGLMFFAVANAKEPPAQVLVWPTSGAPVVRFSFGKFKETSSTGKQHTYTSDVVAENLWSKKISSAEFTLYVYDKNKVRIGDAWLSISDVSPGAEVKFQTFLNVGGAIATLELVPKSLPAELQSFLPQKTISITVNSVPQGAEVKIDGTPSGTTPKIAQVTPGKHILTFSKEGFNSGTFPMEIAPDAVSGGSVSYELGTASHDTIELRDGSVVTGDVESMTATDVVVRVGGTLQNFSRNQVKRIVLIQREPSQ
jgi:PEGA domain